MVDDKTGADQPVTSARQTWQGLGNNQFPGWALPSFGSGPVSIAGGATLRLNPSTVAPPGCGQISGAGMLDLNSTVSGDWGALSLGSGFTGKLLLEKGRVNSNPTTLGGTTNVEVRSGAQLLFYDGTANTYTYPQSCTIAGTGWGESAYPAALRASGQSATLNGPVTLAGDATVMQDGSGQLALNGIISGGYNLTVQASGGAIAFGAANTYSGATTLTAGTLKLAHSLALQNSALNTSGGTTLAFDSSVGSHAFTVAGLSGSGNISLQDNSANPVTLTVGANNSSTTYSGNLSGTGSLTKSGTGKLTLGGANTYTGTTTVNAGTLALNGSLNTGSGSYSDSTSGTLLVNGTLTSGGDVTITGTLGGAGTINANVSDYGTLFPNSPGGTLTVNGSLSLMSKTVMAVNRDSGSPRGDRVSASTLYRYSSLLVTNTGVNSLRSGDSFTLFSWTTASGSFSPVTLPPLMPGLTWLNQLSTLGKISISGTAIPPQIRSSVYSGSSVTFSGTGGVARGTYYVLSSTNVAAAKSTWTPVTTNSFDASGNFSFSASVNSGPRRFYAIAVP
jgi:autotransporter-associated beta strand protein